MGMRLTPSTFAGIALVVVSAGMLPACTPARDPSRLSMVYEGPAPSDPDAADAAVIAQLRRAGSDLSRPADIVHYLYVPTERDARDAAATLRRHGYRVEVHRPLGSLSNGTVSNDWGVLAQTTAVPSLANFRKTRPLFKLLVKQYHGSYDGWEASVVK